MAGINEVTNHQQKRRRLAGSERRHQVAPFNHINYQTLLAICIFLLRCVTYSINPQDSGFIPGISFSSSFNHS